MPLKLLLPDKYDKRGGALWMVVGLLQKFFDIEIEPYHRKKHGILLACNTLPDDMPANMKSVLLVAGCRLKDNGIPRHVDWQLPSKVVFNSKFCQEIALSVYNINNYEIVYIVGGAPADEQRFSPILEKETIGDTINFVCCAKWWKRSFKRLKQIKKLFTEHINPAYPNSVLHVLGMNIPNQEEQDNIICYPKSFHSDIVASVYKKSHIQLMLSPFDTGPMTLTESLHYRVPFVCSNNCCGSELLGLIDGKCGEVVDIDPTINSAALCRKYKPFTDKRFYGRDLDYSSIMVSVSKIIDNYQEYTGWKWTDTFNYESTARQWMSLFSVIENEQDEKTS